MPATPLVPMGPQSAPTSLVTHATCTPATCTPAAWSPGRLPHCHLLRREPGGGVMGGEGGRAAVGSPSHAYPRLLFITSKLLYYKKHHSKLLYYIAPIQDPCIYATL